ncbi:HD domain-containing protein [Sinomicrobium weinanense]|uniref:Metal-dependent HD superfamily phosphohydrolase n=1 Tax=Sinomicrobium weinanense TaxID=2842200 RepID=A0A926Q612_9FLAO|nr:hypothetical protein [Sinomicrobium weinanense]MBC9798565.1 hypothetical protein [Sinomicrobium weinanense]MBU3126017.1 hypothetical protein [Sinomicrobium weinanense]
MVKETFLNLIKKYSDNEDYNLECWNEIEQNYSSKSRHYHTLEHLHNMLSELNGIKPQIEHLDAFLFSVFYHDVIYRPTKKDNELQSAIVFDKRISKTTFQSIEKCVQQIKATKEHKLSSDRDTNFLLDIDLSILGKPTTEYQVYCRNIRKEYKIYPDFMYRKGRKNVLKNLLNLDSIFKTEFFKAKYENQAKENIINELNQLS